ncbi:hypothetical protein EMVG_00320 [Emiliania huxleyi virus PS401]|nr:hypothetical protein EMVG_00320 [Emiliania huxleyi virus PS401]
MKSSKRLKSSDNDDDNMLQKSLSRTLENFRCPLSLRLMVRPIAPGDDQMYDKSSWNEYVKRQHNEHPNMVISPITRETIDMSNVHELPKPVLNTMKDTVIQAANTLSPGDSDMSDVEDWLVRYVKEEEDKVCPLCSLTRSMP